MEIPEWFEEYRLADEPLAASYEETPASWRALLKTGIALSHFHHGSVDAETESRRVSERLGIKEITAKKPVAWAMLVIGADVDAAARISALAIVPRLAGVSEVYAILASRSAPGALVSLELCGIEDIFAAPVEICSKLLADVNDSDALSGRICFLHHGSLAGLSVPGSIPALDLSKKPAILLETPEAFDLAALEFCQGTEISLDRDLCRFWDARLTNRKGGTIASRITLGPGCEGFWEFQDLNPDFFLSHLTALQLV